MIVDDTPRAKQIIREVSAPLLALFIWDVVVTVAYYFLPFTAPSLPLTLFGTVLGLVLGFRVNSAYERWWEGRKLWGSMINASRNIARMAIAFIPDSDARAVDLKRSIILRQIAYVHALRTQLRRQDRAPDVLRLLSEGEAAAPLKAANTANMLLNGNGSRIDEARARGLIDTVQQNRMEAVLVDIANAQGGMERIKNTPLPMQYRFFPTFFARLFCILLPIGLVETLQFATPIGSTLVGLMFLAVLQIGDDLVDPFADTVHDLPLSAMCRTIEIDLLQGIGDPAPEPIQPVKGVLW